MEEAHKAEGNTAQQSQEEKTAQHSGQHRTAQHSSQHSTAEPSHHNYDDVTTTNFGMVTTT